MYKFAKTRGGGGGGLSDTYGICKDRGTNCTVVLILR